MTSICVIQPYLFPYLPYFQLAAAVDEFWVFDDVQYIRRGFMNRNTLAARGERLPFTLPVEKGRREDLILHKRLAEDFPEQLARLVTSLRHSYARAPFRDEVVEIVEGLGAGGDSPGLFVDVAIAGLQRCFAHLGLAPRLRRSSDLGLPPDLRGAQRILAICAATGARRYVNPIGGTALYQDAAFAAQGVELRFLRTGGRPYPQEPGRAFVPALSILDFLAWVAPGDRGAHLRDFTLDTGGDRPEPA